MNTKQYILIASLLAGNAPVHCAKGPFYSQSKAAEENELKLAQFLMLKQCIELGRISANSSPNNTENLECQATGPNGELIIATEKILRNEKVSFSGTTTRISKNGKREVRPIVDPACRHEELEKALLNQKKQDELNNLKSERQEHERLQLQITEQQQIQAQKDRADELRFLLSQAL